MQSDGLSRPAADEPPSTVQAPPQPEAFPVPPKGLWPKAKLNLRRRVLEESFHWLLAAAMTRRPLTVWDLTWFPTFQCNLRCWYCNEIYGKAEPPDPQRALRRIIRLRPASISILGGEPFVLKGMPDYVRQLRRALPDAYLMVTTNGMVKREHILETIPLINTLCVSIDGEGEYQSKPRGGDAEAILANLQAAHERRVELGCEMDLVVNTVVSKYNALHLPDFFLRIKNEISPTILGFCQGLQPFDGPHGLGSAPEIAAEFVRRITEVKKEMRILVAGRLANEQTRAQNLRQVDPRLTQHRLGVCTLRCHQERFYAHVTPSGRVYTCATYSGLQRLRGEVLEHLDHGRYAQAVRAYLRGWHRWVLKAPSFDCAEFEGCPEWAEDIMHLGAGGEPPAELPRVRGRLSEEQVAASVRFIRRHVNPGFDAAWLRAPRGGGNNL